jgi:PAS domain S-box-containing protein
VALVAMDAAGLIVDFSPEAERLLGHRRADVLGRRMSDVIIPARLRGAHNAGLHRYLATGRGPMLDVPSEVPALRSDGTEVAVELVVSRVERAGGPAFHGLLREVAEATRIPGELRLSEEFYRTLVEQSPVAISVLNADGSWRWSSPAGLRLHGPHAPDDPAGALPVAQRALRGEDTGRPTEVRVRGLDGEWHALTVAAQNLLEEPAVHGVVLYGSDITRAHDAEHQVRIESARLSTLIASLRVGILLQDEERRIVLANDTFTRMFDVQVPADELRGSYLADRVPHFPRVFADPDAIGSRVDALVAAGLPLTGEELSLADGRVVERDYTPVHLSGATLGHLWVFRDVTEQAVIRRGLEDRNRALAELAALKTEFIAAASHELRTPLTSIVTFTQLFAEDPDCTPEERDAAIEAISRNADRMLRLVDELILLASLEAGTLPLRRSMVDLADVVRSAVRAMVPEAERARVALADWVADGPTIEGDAERLRQLMDTLTATAVAATPPAGRVEVRASYIDPVWTVSLTSSGRQGDASGHLFTSPDRCDHPRGTPGNALAFLLSRAIVARHGGELSSPGTSGGGSFEVRLPLAAPRRTERRATPRP